MNDESDESKNADIAALAQVDPITYDKQRVGVAKAMGLRLRTLDKQVAECRASLARKQTPCENKPDIKQLAASAKDIIGCDNVLERFAEDLKRRVAGEEKNAELLYLVGTSRLFQQPMDAVVKGPSSGGKSATRASVLQFFPKEDVIAFTALSGKALLYMPDDLRHKILSMGEAISGKEIEFQDYLLRELMSEGKLRYEVVQKGSNGALQTIVIEKQGPVSFIVTTTKNKLNPENETRMLSLEVDDSEDQTRAVLRKVAEVEGYNKSPQAIDFQAWQDFQRWLAVGQRNVVIPFAKTLATMVPAKTVRMRRDFKQLICAIKAHALLHRRHRERNEEGAIRATIDEDYRAVRALMRDLLAASSEGRIGKRIAETIAAVKKVQSAEKNNGASVNTVAEELDLDRTATWRRLQAAERAGHLRKIKRGRSVLYRTVASSSGEVLPTCKDLRKAVRKARKAKS